MLTKTAKIVANAGFETWNAAFVDLQLSFLVVLQIENTLTHMHYRVCLTKKYVYIRQKYLD